LAHTDAMAGSLSERAKAAQKAYLKEWRRKNPDKVRSYNLNYWTKKVLRGLSDPENGKNGNNGNSDKTDGG